MKGNKRPRRCASDYVLRTLAKVISRLEILEGQDTETPNLQETLGSFPGGISALCSRCLCASSTMYHFAAGDRERYPTTLALSVVEAFKVADSTRRPKVTAAMLRRSWDRARLVQAEEAEA